MYVHNLEMKVKRAFCYSVSEQEIDPKIYWQIILNLMKFLDEKLLNVKID